MLRVNRLDAMTLPVGQQLHNSVLLSACCQPRLRLSAFTLRGRPAPTVPVLASQRLGNTGQQGGRKGTQLKSIKTAVRCSSSRQPIVSAAASTPPADFSWGADMKNLGISVGLAAAIWIIPPPAGVTLPAWHLLAIFLGTIVGIITKPLPLGAVAMMGLGATMLTKTLTFAAAFSAFSSEIP